MPKKKEKPVVALRKPSPVPAAVPKSSEDFVAGSTKRQGAKRKLTIYVEEDLARRMKVYCAQHDLEHSELVTELLEGRLGVGSQPGAPR
jgi:hypothetical protein